MSRANYLTVAEHYELMQACRDVVEAFDDVFLVGSALLRPSYRDVDVRAMLDDEDFDRSFGDARRRALVNVAISRLLSARTGLPIDFQIQRRSDANASHSGPRDALIPPPGWPA